MIFANYKLLTKGITMILQTGFLTRMGDEYLGIVSTIESEWTNGALDFDSSILRLIKFADIKKKNARNQLVFLSTTFFITKSPKLESNQAPLRTCIISNCIKKGLTTHYLNCCFLKYPKL